jgi:hypothetical protein
MNRGNGILRVGDICNFIFLDKRYKTISGLCIQRYTQLILTKSWMTKKHEKARVLNIDEDTKANNIDASTHYLKSLKQSSLISCPSTRGRPWLARHAAAGTEE